MKGHFLLMMGAWFLVFSACGPVENEDGDVGTNGEAFCQADLPLQSWETFGRGFLTTHCQGCHASTAPNRYGAPPDVVFDTREEALALKANILVTATSNSPTMPPTGGVSDDDIWRLKVWLECYPNH